MRKKNSFRLLFTALLAAGAMVLPASNAIVPYVSIHTNAATEAELSEKIAANEAYIDELDRKIAEIDTDIANSEELQDYYFRKLMASKEQIDLINGKIYEKEQEIAAKEGEIAAKEEEIRLKEGEISSKEAEIYAVETVISQTEKHIGDKSTEIQLLEQHNLENVEKFGQILHAMYITNTDDYMSVIAGSADFYDIFVRSEILKSVSEQNLDFMHQLLDDIHKLENDKVQLDGDIQQLESDKKALEDDKAVLAEQREGLKYERDVLDTEKSNLLDDKKALDGERAEAQAISDEYTSEYNAVSQQIKDFEERQKNYAYQQQVSRDEIAKWEAEREELIRKAQLAASNSVVYDNGDWIWPLDHVYTRITTYFGWDSEWSRNHGAIDIAGAGIMGQNIYASKSGEVIVAKTSYIPGYDYGMYIVIDHGNGIQTLYAHCSSIYVTVGQMVNQGDVIGAVGSTGYSSGPHLHFEMRENGVRVDPLQRVAIP